MNLVQVKQIEIEGKSVLLALFTTSQASLPGSGLCMFALEDIQKFFSNSGHEFGSCADSRNNKFEVTAQNHQITGKIITFNKQGNRNWASFTLFGIRRLKKLNNKIPDFIIIFRSVVMIQNIFIENLHQ